MKKEIYIQISDQKKLRSMLRIAESLEVPRGKKAKRRRTHIINTISRLLDQIGEFIEVMQKEEMSAREIAMERFLRSIVCEDHKCVDPHCQKAKELLRYDK